ncbi:hypothetical protein [Muriicola sp. Z0-33]|uniref:hypothetical protein n=1 Tax=Muriicola sp. Z0-33 TaxID=2816957 RepID=UPI002236F004|nr:hypothetical protein [Muriicola sp. Z0-33]MCW5515430.1 hypothetical protein [Muriicola sp. Z0-33]
MKSLLLTILMSITAMSFIQAQGGISIHNFNAENLSSSEIEVSVEYSFSREVDTKGMVIRAFPVMADGKANYRDVLLESHQIEVGNHNASFKISKKPGGKDFSSESIKVCMIANRSIILCEAFPFPMTWSLAAASPVEIISFSTSKDFAEKGETVTLSWETENASKVSLLQKGTRALFSVPTSGSKNVVIDKTSTYVLMASAGSSKGPTKVESKNVRIEVENNEPVLGNFYASRPTVRRGIASKLLWDVYNADKVTLNGEPVEAIGDKIVSPIRTTRYLLRAQKGDNVKEEFLSIYVTPFAPPKLSDPIYSLEICKRIDTNNGYSRCISSDGPFVTGDEILVMVRLKGLPRGESSIKRITYRGLFGKDKWTKAHQEESTFTNTSTGERLLTFPVVNLGEGAKKLEIVINGNKESTSEIVYCVDCSRLWE